MNIVTTTQVTYSWIYEAQKYHGSNHSPDCISRTLLKTLIDYVKQTVTHTAQFWREPVISLDDNNIVNTEWIVKH